MDEYECLCEERLGELGLCEPWNTNPENMTQFERERWQRAEGSWVTEEDANRPSVIYPPDGLEGPGYDANWQGCLHTGSCFA